MKGIARVVSFILLMSCAAVISAQQAVMSVQQQGQQQSQQQAKQQGQQEVAPSTSDDMTATSTGTSISTSNNIASPNLNAAKDANANTNTSLPKDAVQRLLQGNKRFLEDKTTCPDRNQIRRLATFAKQKPFAIILGCSDSRIPPEIAFDQGIGDIFVVRVAGNIVSAVELNSIEYSAIYNDSKVVIVLGHQNCGAVQAVLKNQTQDIPAIAKLINTGIKKNDSSKNSKAKLSSNGISDAELLSATEANIRNSVQKIKESPAIQKLMKAGKIDVLGAYYDFSTGEVRVLDPK